MTILAILWLWQAYFCEQKFNWNLFSFEPWRKNNKFQLQRWYNFLISRRAIFNMWFLFSSYNAPIGFILSLMNIQRHKRQVVNIIKSFWKYKYKDNFPICHLLHSWAKKGAKNTWHAFLLTLYFHSRAISYSNHITTYQILAKFNFYDVFFCVFFKIVTIW